MTYDAFIQEAKAAKIGDSKIVIDSVEYWYDILPASFQPRIPYFAANWDGYLLISEEVPPIFRSGFVAHDVLCRQYWRDKVPNGCLQAAMDELKHVPAVANINEYLRLRIEMLEAMIAVYQEQGDEEQWRGLVPTRDHFHALLVK